MKKVQFKLGYLQPKVKLASLRSRQVVCTSPTGINNMDLDDETEI